MALYGTTSREALATGRWLRPGAAAVGLLAVLLAAPAAAQPDYDKVEFSTVAVAKGLHMLSGAGGNIGVLAGPEGVLLIDDELAPLAPKLQAAIAALSDRPVRFVLNTHWHFDHVGGNEALAGSGALVMAHAKVRERMAAGLAASAFGPVPPAPAAALPVLGFEDGITLHLNGETVEVRHVAPAHTDGDAVVYFWGANAVHMGDLYWNGLYPLVDASSGGSLNGVIAGVAGVLARIDAGTRVIPGHGPLGDKASLQAYHDMLQTVSERISRLRAEGRSVEEIVAAKPTAEYDTAWGGGLFSGEQWVRIVAGAP